jgi:imidazolonepropionase-like amidohydrolase
MGTPRTGPATGPFVRLVLLGATAIGTVLAAQQPVAKPPVLVEGARILDVAAGRYLAPANVFIEKGRIKSVAPDPATSIPEGTVRVKATGSVLVPGLIDAHAWAAPTSDLDVDYFYLMGLAHGVTGYRVLNVRTSWGVAQRERSIAGAILSPRLWTSGRGINRGASPDRWLFDAPDPSSAVGEVARQVDAAVNWIAGYEALAPDMYKAIVTAARRTGARVSGRPGAASMSDLAAAGVASIETIAYPVKPANGLADDAWLAAGTKDLAALQTRLVRARVTLVPMMAAAMARAFPDDVASDPALVLLPDARRAELAAALAQRPEADVVKAKRAWTSQAAFLKRFVKARGRVAAGTGFELGGYPAPGVGLHRELQALVRAGLAPIDALRAATWTAAELVGAGSASMRFAPGADADFIVVQGDPLKRIEDLANITHVVRAGEVFDPKMLLARAKQSARRP